MNIQPGYTPYADAVRRFIFDIGYEPGDVEAVNITNGRIELDLSGEPHHNPALSSHQIVTIDITGALS